MSFRTRLVLSAAYLLSVVVLALEIPLAVNVERRATSQLEASVIGNASTLAANSANLVAQAGGRPAVARQALPELRRILKQATATEPGRVIVVDAEGRLLADSDGAAAGQVYATPQRPELGAVLASGRIDTRQRHSDTLGEDLLLVTVPVVDDKLVGALRVSEPMGEVRSSVHSSWLRLGLIGIAVIAAGLALAWLLAATLARPLERLSGAATRLGGGDLEARVEPEGPRELVALAESFNRMARALGANLTAQRDFIANASHQLRTPLTGIKLRLEAIREEGGETAAQAARAESELDRLNSLVDDLLSLARASTLEAAAAPVDLADAARDAVRRWTGPAQSADQQLSLGREEPAPMWGDPTDIAHILDNLIENAIRYGLAGNRITIDTARQGSVSSLTVSDTGLGIPEQDRSRIFERFYRGTNGRKAGPGTGLGLAIAGELAERWRGRVELAGGDGARFEVSFPARSDAP